MTNLKLKKGKSQVQKAEQRQCPVNGCSTMLRGAEYFCTVCNGFIYDRERYMMEVVIKKMRDFQAGVINARIAEGKPRSTPIIIPEKLGQEYGTIMNYVCRTIVYNRNIDAIATHVESTFLSWNAANIFRTYRKWMNAFPVDKIYAAIEAARYKANVNVIKKAMQQMEALLKAVQTMVTWYEMELESDMTIEEYEQKELRDYKSYQEYKRARLVDAT